MLTALGSKTEGEIRRHWQQTISVRERSLKSDPDFIERVMKGVVAGNAFSLDPRNKERVKQITAKYLRLDSVDKGEEHYYQHSK